MKKVLIVTHNSRFIVLFELNNIKLLVDKGYEVHCATNFRDETMIINAQEQIEQAGAIVHQIDIERLRFTPKVFVKNLKACFQLKKIFKLGFSAVHCHTPIGGVVTRLASLLNPKKGMKVIYTAHGFHFYEGAPKFNWFVYYPIEKALSRVTDALITINSEDYMLALQNFYAKKVYHVPGVGVNTHFFCTDIDVRNRKRKEFHLKQNDIVLLSVGEVNKNKNHKIVIKALAQLKKQGYANNLYYIICGKGPLEDEYRKLSQRLGIADKVFLVGFATDVKEYYQMSDIFVFPSIREGLGLAAIEAMSCGMPIVATDNRGTREYIQNDKNGFLCNASDEKQFAVSIKRLIDVPELRCEFGKNNQIVAQEYDIEKVREQFSKIYDELLGTWSESV